MPNAKRVHRAKGPKIVRPTPAVQAPLISAVATEHQPKLLRDAAADEAAKLIQPDMRACRRCTEAAGKQVLHPVSAFRQGRRRDGTTYYRPDCRASSWRHDAEKAETDLTREALDKVQTAVTQIMAAYGIDARINLQALQAS